jgi:tetratricopeptide (TPR) repeat protein
MNGTWKRWMGVVAASGLVLSMSALANAQTAQSGQSQPAQQSTDKDKKPDVKDLTLDGATPAAAPAPVNAEEDAAYKAFLAETDPTKKIGLGEAFAQKYPESRYRPPVYSSLTSLYLQTNQVPKMEEIGDKEIALNPNDVQVMAILAQTLPRAMSASTPNPDKELAKAADYAKRAIELTPTIAKPEGITDDMFVKAKDQTLAMAHSGLGLVYVRQGKFKDAIPELEQSVKIDPSPDPVNYYLLGLANKSASHFDDAVTAFNKCAAIPGQMVTTCKSGAEEAKKLSTTQLSAPK